VRLADINESLRDLLSGTLDTYLSVTSNRMNEIMKVLTIVTVLFMPMTVLTGFFGMNFEALPLRGYGVLTIAIILMIAVPAGMLYYFRKRGWM
jgi:magnesium transporter